MLSESLLGNSKALVDEEKFRKSGKKKFEMISEKLLEAARSAQSCSGGFPMDISKLSSSGQDLLRGKVHERTELMHLHTMTHGAKRWSGESENHDEQNNENHILLNHVEPQCTGPTPTPGKKLANKKVSTKKETTTRSFHPPR